MTNRLHHINTILPILVFAVALSTRLYWIHEKENLYGDELTSICIAYNHPGWGEKTYKAGYAYTGKELRKCIYKDEQGGLIGLKQDLVALQKDNRDLSHASLYYMALRCFLTGVETPSMDSLVRYSCGLNMLLFLLSFGSMFVLLRNLFPNRSGLIAFCLLLAFMNPASISNTLLVREYPMAEWLFVLWAYWCVRKKEQMKQNAPSLGLTSSGMILSAALFSCGYFNVLFWGISVLFLIKTSHRGKEDFLSFLIMGIMAVVLSLCMYEGFLNFLDDTRTAEVSGKMRGEGFLMNLYSTLRNGVAILLVKVVTPVWAVVLGVMAGSCLLCRKHERPTFRIPHGEVFLGATLWMIAALWLSTWKMTRYISAAFPLFMTGIACYLYAYIPQNKRRMLLVPFSILFIAYSFCEYPIENLERSNNWPWTVNAKRILLYGPNAAEKNTLTLLIPFMHDAQECVIVESADELSRNTPKDEAVYHVFGEQSNPTLKAGQGFIKEETFNSWMSIYTFNAQ